jgi:N-acetylmuramoyl-L-alanine amidase
MFRIILWLNLGFIFGSHLDAQPPYKTNHSTKLNPIKQLCSKEALEKTNALPIVQKAFIVIDPGHGGHDVGTQSISKPRYQEKSLNLVTAKFISQYLQQLGYRVWMTREDDRFISLDRRAQLANEAKPTLFVSVHYNSAPSSEAQGVEVFFYQSDNKERTRSSKYLAQIILKSVLVETKAKSRGVKHGNFAVIRETNMPAVLIEGGFVTNEEELKKLKDPSYLKKIALGVTKGIDEYIEKKEKLESKKKTPVYKKTKKVACLDETIQMCA